MCVCWYPRSIKLAAAVNKPQSDDSWHRTDNFSSTKYKQPCMWWSWILLTHTHTHMHMNHRERPYLCLPSRSKNVNEPRRKVGWMGLSTNQIVTAYAVAFEAPRLYLQDKKQPAHMRQGFHQLTGVGRSTPLCHWRTPNGVVGFMRVISYLSERTRSDGDTVENTTWRERLRLWKCN